MRALSFATLSDICVTDMRACIRETVFVSRATVSSCCTRGGLYYKGVQADAYCTQWKKADNLPIVLKMLLKSFSTERTFGNTLNMPRLLLDLYFDKYKLFILFK